MFGEDGRCDKGGSLTYETHTVSLLRATASEQVIVHRSQVDL
jgi:hypothetical protein